MTIQRRETITPAMAAAAAVCWLARFRFGGMSEIAGAGTFMHRDGCRFCKVDPRELLGRYGLAECDPDAIGAFEKLPRAAQAARVHEAQEEEWWNEIPEANA